MPATSPLSDRSSRYLCIWRDLKRHHLARQTFASPDGLDRAIHDAVAKVNAERHCHPLDSQQTTA